MAVPFSLRGGPRLALRHRFVLAVVVAVLIAFGVVMAMAALLPPDGRRAIRLDAVAAALRGPGDATLTRVVTAGAPAGGDRWLEVPGVRRQLAALLRVNADDVRLVVASPVGARPVTGAPVRAGFLPFDQATDSPAPSPVVVAPPPPVVVVDPPAVATPAPVVPRTTEPVRARPVVRASVAERTVPRVAAPVVVAPAPVAVVVPVPPVARPAPAPVAAKVVVPKPMGAVPEITGAFRAALKLPGGGWAVVTPRAETAPTQAQQRMILWFVVALAITLPLAWGVALWLVRPLRGFVLAAERSGRDPAAPMAGSGLTELAPAAAAITRLQGRIQALSNDRAAFAGTVRNELRAPLDRLRAGLEDVPRQVREVFHDPVTDIEEAVAALELFLTDAAAPGVLERHDLGELIRMTAVAAAARGEPVTADAPAAVRVEVDPVAIRRLLDQLIVYARRRGRGVTMTLAIDAGVAVVTMTESAQPMVAGFASGLRGKAERASGARPTGPGLAVARSIARGHGGEVRLVRSEAGMIAELRLPLV